MDQHNRYVLSLEVLPEGQQDKLLTLHSAHASVPAALEALLQRPMDQFHPTSAANKKLPYIRNAQIFDLGKGLPVYSTELFSSPDGEIGGLFLKIEDPAYPFASRQLSYNSGDEPWARDSLLLMVFENSAGYLRPDNLFYRISADCAGVTMNAEALDFNNQFVMVAIGYKLTGASVIGDAIVYPSFSEQHYFPSISSAFAKLIRLPADEFEKEYALANGLPHYYLKAHISSKADPQIPLMDMFACIPGRSLAGYPELPPGRHLYFNQGTEDMNHSLGINVGAEDGMVAGVNVFMLDAWVKNGNRAFVQQPFGQACEAAAPDLPDVGNAPEFTVSAALHPLVAEDFNNQYQSVTDIFEYHYTNDFSEALFRMLTCSVVRFDLQSAKRYNSPFLITDYQLLDKEQRLISKYLLVDEQDKFPGKGLYFGLHGDLMQHPVIQGLDLEVLKDGAQYYDIKEGDMRYFQAAVYRDDMLVINPGFEKFGLYHSWNHIAQVKANNPGACLVLPPSVTDEHPYRLLFEWIAPQTDGPARFKYIEGFNTPWGALKLMELVPRENFFPPDEAGPPRPLVLDKIKLCNQAGEAIVVKGTDMTLTDRVYLDFNRTLANDTVYEAFIALINGKLTSGPEQHKQGDERKPAEASRSRKHRPGHNKGRGI